VEDHDRATRFLKRHLEYRVLLRHLLVLLDVSPFPVDEHRLLAFRPRQEFRGLGSESHVGYVIAGVPPPQDAAGTRRVELVTMVVFSRHERTGPYRSGVRAR
jgi:hypothetical protein